MLPDYLTVTVTSLSLHPKVSVTDPFTIAAANKQSWFSGSLEVYSSSEVRIRTYFTQRLCCIRQHELLVSTRVHMDILKMNV